MNNQPIVESPTSPDFKERADKFISEVKKLSEHYRIDIVGALDFTPTAVKAKISIVDMIKEYQQEVKE